MSRDYAALEGRPVTQGHVDHCKTHGHATHTVDGVVQPHCPRCGVVPKGLGLERSGLLIRSGVLVGQTVLGVDTATGLVVLWNGSKLYKVVAVSRAGEVEEEESWIAYEAPTLAEATAVAETYLADARRETDS